MWRGAHLPLSHTHTPSQIFQNTLCIICWHKQSSQCLVCPLSICDNASVGSCSGGPASLCFLGSPVVLELSEGRKYALMSQVLSNTSVKVFFGTKTSLRPPNFFFLGGGEGLRTPCPSYSAAYDILIVLETTEDHKDQVIYIARPVL